MPPRLAGQASGDAAVDYCPYIGPPARPGTGRHGRVRLNEEASLSGGRREMSTSSFQAAALARGA